MSSTNQSKFGNAAAEDEERRLRERLKQRQHDRQQKSRGEELSEVSNKSSDLQPSKSSNKERNSKNNSESSENFTGGSKNESEGSIKNNKNSTNANNNRRRDFKGRIGGGEGGKRPEGIGPPGKRTNSDGNGPPRRKRKRRGGRRRRRPRREDHPSEMYRDSREFYHHSQFPNRPPHFFEPPRGGGRFGFDHRYYNEFDRHPHPRERYEREREDYYNRDRRYDQRHERDRERKRGRSRSRSISGDSYDSRSFSSSRSRSRSYSDDSSRSRSISPDDRNRGRRRRSDSSCSSKTNSTVEVKAAAEEVDPVTKDQRTVFISQLVMRADEKDIRRYFGRKGNCKVNDVILLKDRRTGRHKGSAYVELVKIEDVPKALKLNAVVPDFQRFPILIKASDAEKNYDLGVIVASTLQTELGKYPYNNAISLSSGSNIAQSSKSYQMQNVYVGSIDRCVTQAQLYALFSQFGQLDKVALQTDTTTGMSRGFAFLSYRHAKDANLAIQTMSGQQLAGRALKTGWANEPSAPGVEAMKSDEFPEDSAVKIQNAHLVLTQLTGSGLMAMASLGLATGASLTGSQDATSTIAGPQVMPVMTVAEAAVNAALGENDSPSEENDNKFIKGTPSCVFLISNMFDKDQETEEGWENDVKEDFVEECTKYGVISKGSNGEPLVKVEHDKPGGMVYAQFENIEMATKCTSAIAGRWFDKRQLRVEFVPEFPND